MGSLEAEEEEDVEIEDNGIGAERFNLEVDSKKLGGLLYAEFCLKDKLTDSSSNVDFGVNDMFGEFGGLNTSKIAECKLALPV